MLSCAGLKHQPCLQRNLAYKVRYSHTDMLGLGHGMLCLSDGGALLLSL